MNAGLPGLYRILNCAVESNSQVCNLILSHLQASKLAFTVSQMLKEDVRHLSQKEKTVSPTAQDKKHELFISIPLAPKFHQRNTKEPR